MPAREEQPDRRLLADFLLGRLGGSEQEYVEQRLITDRRWLQAAGEVEAYDALVENVCRVGVSLPTTDPAPVRELIGRLEGLRRSSAPDVADDASAVPSRTPLHSAIDYSSLRPAEKPDELGRLAGFRVLRLVGAGGMGIVFEAEDPVLRRRVALKVMRPAFAATPIHRQRFLREARAAAALRHDHIIEIYQVGEDNGVPFLTMPLLAGESLEHCLSHQTALDLPDVLGIGREIAAGLAAAHAAGVIHRDIKPANIWLETLADCRTQEAALRNPQRLIGRVKLLDFGLARVLEDDDGLTLSGAVVGTPGYLAPEQAEGAVADCRSDLFAFGCVLYRMATRQEPFPGTTQDARLAAAVNHQPLSPHRVNENVPQPLSDLIRRLLAKDPDKRPQSAAEVTARLSALASAESVGESTKQPEPGAEELSRPPGRWSLPSRVSSYHGTMRHSIRWLTAAVVGLCLLLALVALFRMSRGPSSTALNTDDKGTPTPTYQGSVDVLVWTKANGDARRMRLIDEGALPLHPGDQFRIEAKVEPAAYLYLFWIDEEGIVAPLHPWQPPSRTGGGWHTRPPQEQKESALHLPPLEWRGYTIQPGQEGMLTLLLLARPDPLPLDDTQVQRLFANLPPQRPVQDPRAAVWFENGTIVTNDQRRKRQWFEESVINDPVLRLQTLLRDRLQAHAAFTAAVSFAKQAK
jgi:serine/threonine protein kinase